MRNRNQLLSITAALLYGCTQVLAQGIEIDKLLKDTAPEWNVKIGTAWPGKISKYRFGEYEVVKSKQGTTKSSYNQKLFSRDANSTTELEFSFVLCNKAKDSIFVSAAYRSKTEERQAALEFEWLSIGESGILSESDYFEVRTSLEGSKETDWLMLLARSWKEGQGEEEISEMSNGQQNIQIIPIRSPLDDSRKIPALGYEFGSDGEVLAAVQYYGGGMFGLNKNRVWLRPELSSELKLVLAGAMTALMEYKLQAGAF